MTTLTRRLFLTLLLGAAVLIGLPARAGERELWYSIEMMGQKSGWMKSVETNDGRTITRVSETSIQVKRGPIEMSIGMSSRFVETVDGKLLSMWSRQAIAGAPIEYEYTFNPADVTVVTRQGGQESRSTRPLPSVAYLAPAAAERHVKKHMTAGAPRIEVVTLDPSTGLEPITFTRHGFSRTTLDIGGRKVNVLKCSTEASNLPGVVSTEYLDEDGAMVMSETNLGGIAMTTRRVPKAEAISDADAPELMMSTFVTPDREIADARNTTFAVYRLSVADGELPDLPSTGVQTFQRQSRAEARVTIDTAKPQPATPAEIADRAYLAASAMVNIDDPKIKELAKKAVANAGPGPRARAEACRDFVFKYIHKKSLGVGFASASEVAQTCEGDCSEHGVLLAALLRANGIPARVVTGLIYADQFAGAEGIFGYHMWAQALLDVDGAKRWIDLDATLPTGHFDATHITAAVSALEDGAMQSSFASLIGLLGKLQISVEQAR